MLKYILLILLFLMILFVGYGTPAHAEIITGVECQLVAGNPELTTVKLGLSLSEQWLFRGIYSWYEKDLSMGLLYYKKPASHLRSYVGLGIRDLLNTRPDLSIGQKVEFLTGFEYDLHYLASGLSVALEVRVIPSDLASSQENQSDFIPFLGFSLNYRFSGREPSKPVPGIDENDRFLLARLITAEAGSEPYKGQVAVGAVVINRIHSSQFPRTIPEVIYQAGQFSSVPKLSDLEPTETSLRAAAEALQGVDPSGGALYFYNPSTCSEEGLRFFHSSNLKVTVRIGNHVFLK